jgi:Tol biopolymer transport system component
VDAGSTGAFGRRPLRRVGVVLALGTALAATAAGAAAASGSTEMVSVDSAGNEANSQSDGPGIRGGSSWGPDISGDGRFVAFDSIATNLVAADTNTCGPFYQSPAGACPDIFVHDRLTGETRRVSVDSAGAQANAASTDPAISSDGSVVAFFSPATNLVANDTNTCPAFGTPPGACPDVFVHVE